MDIHDLIEFFSKTKLTDENIRLNDCMVIHNQKKFVESHVKILLSNKGKRVFKPYYDRLYSLYVILKK